jgi:hypothetical protein
MFWALLPQATATEPHPILQNDLVALRLCKELDARSLIGGGGELGDLKNLNLWLHYFSQG